MPASLFVRHAFFASVLTPCWSSLVGLEALLVPGLILGRLLPHMAQARLAFVSNRLKWVPRLLTRVPRGQRKSVRTRRVVAGRVLRYSRRLCIKGSTKYLAPFELAFAAMYIDRGPLPIALSSSVPYDRHRRLQGVQPPFEIPAYRLFMSVAAVLSDMSRIAPHVPTYRIMGTVPRGVKSFGTSLCSSLIHVPRSLPRVLLYYSVRSADIIDDIPLPHNLVKPTLTHPLPLTNLS